MYEKFSTLLSKHNKTIYRVSVDTGIATSTLYDWRDGKSKPKVDKLKILADYFGVSIEYFLDIEEKKEPTLNDMRIENGLNPISEAQQ